MYKLQSQAGSLCLEFIHLAEPLMSVRPTERQRGKRRNQRAAIMSALPLQANRFAAIPESAGINRRSVVNERVTR